MRETIRLKENGMKRLMRFVVLIVFAALISSCATVLQGTNQSITVDSDPRGATVFVAGQQMGQTPVTFTVNKRRSAPEMRVELEGHRTQSRPLTTSYDPVAILNIFWDLSTTDLITGAAWKYNPDSYFFRLDPQ